MNHREKMHQITREARASGLAALAIILFWVLAGFGVSCLDITIWHLPLWTVTGCLGTWLFACFLSVWLTRRVFKDFDLDAESEEPDGESGQVPGAQPAAPGPETVRQSCPQSVQHTRMPGLKCDRHDGQGGRP